MNDIICPNCNKAFKVDEAGYAAILKQVRDHQFQEELANRLRIAEREKQQAVALAEEKIKGSLSQQLSAKVQEINDLKAKHELYLAQELAKKNEALSHLEAKLDRAETEQKLSVAEAIKSIVIT